MANTNVATAPMTPPIIALVFELPLPDVAVALPVGVEVLEAPINAPGPISGLSKKRKV